MTTIVNYSDLDLAAEHPRRKLRDLDRDTFIQQYGSGTLRKSQRLGFDIQEAYLQERIRFEFGSGFEAIQRSRVTYSDLKLEPYQALTELGWHAERMITLRPFESDTFLCKQLDIEYANGQMRHGAGILVSTTSCNWIPAGYMVFSLVAERKYGKYQAAINPF